jgi:pyridoxal 5'-phosphate synthase pdxT subunit
MLIGILAIQGAFIEHKHMLDLLHVDSFEIRQKKDLHQKMDGLILPGGESTAMHRLLTDLDLYKDLKDMILNGLPVFGTCAGMILLANDISNQEINHLKVMNITVERNAYGRQLGSFLTHDLFNGTKIPMTFIRAPYVKDYGKDVLVLSTVRDRVVAVREKNMLATAFHPELSGNTTIHSYFIQMIKDSKK